MVPTIGRRSGDLATGAVVCVGLDIFIVFFEKNIFDMYDFAFFDDTI